MSKHSSSLLASLNQATLSDSKHEQLVMEVHGTRAAVGVVWYHGVSRELKVGRSLRA